MTTNINNMMNIIDIARSGNPQQLVMNMLEQRAQSNPRYADILSLVKQGKTQDVEKIVRNIASERGMNFDQAFNNFRRDFGL